MTQIDAQLSTGLPALDRVLRGVLPGDNIVWQVESVEDYRPFVDPYCRDAAARGRRLVYFRFARHEPLLPDGFPAEVHVLDPAAGFEAFVAEIHRTIENVGRGGFYVFDCLSDLSADWYSDQMLGNFFLLTCPYLFDIQAVAYFSLLRDHHSDAAASTINETAQVLLNVYRHRGRLFVHPLKVQQRHSSTMYMMHEWREDKFLPVTRSAVISEVMDTVPVFAQETSRRRLGAWDRTLAEAEDLAGAQRLEQGDPKRLDEAFHHLLRMLVSRDERVLALAEKYLTLTDVLETAKRMIGTGLMGGKSVGMLVGRAILLLGPGRWGTTTPSLGVPVTFADINTVSSLCEIVAMRDDLVPDVSLGTHFFNELVEMDILYLALYPNRLGNRLNREFLEAGPNRLGQLLPEAGRWENVVRVIDEADLPSDRRLLLYADSVKQRVICCLDRRG